jgi:hypothetical protein
VRETGWERIGNKRFCGHDRILFSQLLFDESLLSFRLSNLIVDETQKVRGPATRSWRRYEPF